MKEREIWIDWLRVVACFLVMMTHACEPFYLGGEGTLVLTRSDALWVSVLNVLPRACVALFVVASSYLLLPMRYSSGGLSGDASPGSLSLSSSGLSFMLLPLGIRWRTSGH